MKYLAIIEVTEKSTNIRFDETHVFDLSGIDIFDTLLREMTCQVQDRENSASAIKNMWNSPSTFIEE